MHRHLAVALALAGALTVRVAAQETERQAPSPQAATPIALRHSLAVKDTFQFVIAVEAKVELDEAKNNSAMTFRLHFAAEVAAQNHCVADMRCRLTRIEATLRSPTANVVFDSNLAERDSPLEQLRGLTGQVFTVAVDDRGRISRVDAPPPVAALAKERLGTDFRSLFASYFLELPEAAVEPGTGWKSEVSLIDPATAGAKNASVDNRVIAVADDRVTIGRTLQLPTPPMRPGIRFSVQKAAGTAVFDPRSGRLVTSDLEVIARAERTEKPAPMQSTSGTTTLRIRAETVTPATPPR